MNNGKKAGIGFLNNFLTLWILLAMVVGIGFGYFFPTFSKWLSGIAVGTTSIPIAVGLVIMMYPPFAKVNYKSLTKVFKDKKALTVSIISSWFLGPLVMFLLSVLFFRNEPHYMVGLIIIGISTCVAMVIIWNDLAGGDNEFAAALVALNALFQVFFYSIYVYLFVKVVPGMLGLKGENIHVSIGQVASTVAIYLGIPFITGMLTKLLLEEKKGAEWYQKVFVPKINPIALIALLYTIVLMFSFKGKYIVELPIDTVRIALPLVIYFAIVFFLMFFICYKFGFGYKKTVAISMIASSNNFELAIAVAVGVFGIESKEAFTAVIGPLIEVPVMLCLVNVARFFERKYFRKSPNT
ncbi:MAG: ACR3 family arsenite efflux transporter [Bacillota bacterium]|nr:ACR3 family arsenite efflux transporter [Bacillota bacterium]